MPGIEIQPFADEHLDAAAELLAERHRRHRAAEPLLPEAIGFGAEIEALRADGASGLVGLRDGEPVAYLLGRRRRDELWGPNVWVELAGQAVEEPEVVRDLYAAAAEHWVEEARTRHYVIVPAADEALVDAWFRLGFGAQQAMGIREVGDEAAVEPPSVTLREVDEGDVDALVELAPVLNEHQSLAPVFSQRPPWPEEEVRAEIVKDLASPQIGSFVAEVDGRIVANFVVCPVELSEAHSGPARPPRTALLAFAATRPEARGTGAGLALTSACFVWAREQGYPTIVTDWRETNLLASRFWPKRGFRRTFLRLSRSIP